MTRDEQITALAMYLTPEQFGEGITCSIPGETFFVSRTEYLERRAELINEPDDADAPEWANFKAQDADGHWYWYEFEPNQRHHAATWNLTGLGRYRLAPRGAIPAGHDWKKTLKPVDRKPALEWNSERYPPQGTICEALIRKDSVHRDWVAGEAGASVTLPNNKFGRLFAAGLNTHVISSSADFRPIRTEEDDAVKEMANVLHQAYIDGGEFPTSELTRDDAEAYARALYRAGYLKP